MVDFAQVQHVVMTLGMKLLAADPLKVARAISTAQQEATKMLMTNQM
jgi:hypothetical protein